MGMVNTMKFRHLWVTTAKCNNNNHPTGTLSVGGWSRWDQFNPGQTILQRSDEIVPLINQVFNTKNRCYLYMFIILRTICRNILYITIRCSVLVNCKIVDMIVTRQEGLG